MFDLDQWREIWDTIRANKLRTVLTGFAVAWGILMLVILLASGTGLSHGVEYQWRDRAVNSVRIVGRQTSLPYRGLKPGRSVRFRNGDYEDIRGRVMGVEKISSRFTIPEPVTVGYRGESGAYDVRAVHPDFRFIEKTIMVRGRFLNELDQGDARKVAVIGNRVDDQLFKGRESLGEWIAIKGVPFRVVGVFTDEGGDEKQELVYVPVSTAQRTFAGQDRIGAIAFTTGDATLDECEQIVDKVRLRLAARNDFSPADPRALLVLNTLDGYMRVQRLLKGVRVFVWVIGIGTLLAGVVGVSNILMIAVRERTREIGIRKVVGGTPASIVGLVLQEAILITTVAGYAGLLCGVALVEIFARCVPQSDYFRDPQVDVRVTLSATLVLVAAGAVAGFFPARRAAAIRPVEALRDE